MTSLESRMTSLESRLTSIERERRAQTWKADRGDDGFARRWRSCRGHQALTWAWQSDADVCGMTRERISTTVDGELLGSARKLRAA